MVKDGPLSELSVDSKKELK